MIRIIIGSASLSLFLSYWTSGAIHTASPASPPPTMGERIVFSTEEGCQMRVLKNQVFFEGCNVHIINSPRDKGEPDVGNGLGNLIIGKNECPPGNQGCDPSFPGMGTDSKRMGSHNFILGHRHQWTEKGNYSVVFGSENKMSSDYSGILGGRFNSILDTEFGTIV